MNEFQVSLNSIALDESLAAFQGALADESAALETIADDLRAMSARQFSSEGAAGGTPWAPLAASTLRTRRADSGILVATGALRGSLGDAGAAGHVEESDGLQLLFGTDLPYAIFHQTGTRRMPARPVVALTGESVEGWLGIVLSGIQGKLVLLGADALGGKKV